MYVWSSAGVWQKTLFVSISWFKKLKWVKSILAGHADSLWVFCSCASPIRSHICIQKITVSAPHNQLGKTKKDKNIFTACQRQTSGSIQARVISHGRDCMNAPMIFCCIPKCICLWWYCQFLSISFRLWSANGLQYQFTCCPSFGEAVNSCLKHSPKLFLLMAAQVHASHWVEGSRFMSNKRVERMGTSDSLTKAIFVSSKQLHPGRPDAFNVGTVKLWFKYQFKNSKIV